MMLICFHSLHDARPLYFKEMLTIAKPRGGYNFRWSKDAISLEEPSTRLVTCGDRALISVLQLPDFGISCLSISENLLLYNTYFFRLTYIERLFYLHHFSIFNEHWSLLKTVIYFYNLNVKISSSHKCNCFCVL